MENLKQVFQALETITAATRQPQELRFMVAEKSFCFRVEKVGEDFTISTVINYCTRQTNYILDSMVVDKITDKYIFMYKYSMLDNRTDEKLALSDIKITK